MSENLQSASESLEQHPQAIRVTFSYDGYAIELISAQRLAKFVPRSDPLEDGGDQSGFWIELRGKDGGRIFRRLLHDPMAQDREVFPENLHGEIIRRPIAHPKGIFSVLIPEIHESHTVHLMGSPAEGHRRGERATERAKFDSAAIRRNVEEYRP